MFDQVHRNVDKHLEALESTADAANHQVGTYVDTDHNFAGNLGGGE